MTLSVRLWVAVLATGLVAAATWGVQLHQTTVQQAEEIASLSAQVARNEQASSEVVTAVEAVAALEQRLADLEGEVGALRSVEGRVRDLEDEVGVFLSVEGRIRDLEDGAVRLQSLEGRVTEVQGDLTAMQGFGWSPFFDASLTELSDRVSQLESCTDSIRSAVQGFGSFLQC